MPAWLHHRISSSGSGCIGIALIKPIAASEAQPYLKALQRLLQSLLTSFPYDRVYQHTDIFNFDFHAIPWLQEDRWGSGGADAGWGSGENQVPWMQGDQLRNVSDDFIHLENQLFGRRILQGLAVQAQANTNVVGIDFICGDQIWSRGGKCVGGFS